MCPPTRTEATAEEMQATRVFKLSPELEQELREAVADIERGDCLELTPAQLKEWAETGDLRVLDEWLAESHD